MFHQRREDESPHSSPAHRYPGGESSPGGEVTLGRHHARDVDGPEPEAGHEAVADQELGDVVSVAGREEAEGGQEGARDTDWPGPVPGHEAGH